MKRLVIRQDDRVLHHELGNEAITIGRDPSCDLYFTDQRLSRQHCRIGVTPDGVRFDDLGSRNGSYVDSKRVETAMLSPNQIVRFGGISMHYEEVGPPEPPAPAPEEDATVVLSASVPEEAQTVMLKSPPPEATPRMIETAPRKPPASPAPVEDVEDVEDEEDQTVLLSPEPDVAAEKDVKPALPKTRILDANALAGNASKGASDTMLLRPGASPGTAPPPTPARPVAARPLEPPRPPAPEPGPLASLPWSAKFLILVSSVALLVYVVLAIPLVRTLGSALREESLRRGRALLSLTAAENGAAVGEGRERDASVDSVLREERVKEALLLDLEGNVVAPSSRADEVLTRIEGIDAELEDIRTFYLGRRGSDYVMVQPLLHASRRVGLAVVVYEAATASGSWASAVLFLSFMVTLLGVVAALVVAKRMTLEPLSSLRDDVEAVIKGDAEHVPVQQSFGELSELAKSVNRLVARAPAAPATPPPVREQPPSPMPEPGPVPRTSAASSAGAASAGATSTSRRPVTAAIQASPDPDAVRFWIDQNYVVVQADDEAASLVGAGAGMEGKHLIEAVAEQKLLEAILDAINALAALPAAETTADLPNGETLHVRAALEQGRTVVALRKL